MEPHRQAHEGLGQAQRLRHEPSLGREDEDQVHEQQQEVQDVAQRLHDLHAHVGGLRCRVEKPQRLHPRGDGGEWEDGEVDREIDLDEEEEFLEGEVGFDSAEDEWYENEWDDDECERD